MNLRTVGLLEPASERRRKGKKPSLKSSLSVPGLNVGLCGAAPLMPLEALGVACTVLYRS